MLPSRSPLESAADTPAPEAELRPHPTAPAAAPQDVFLLSNTSVRSGSTVEADRDNGGLVSPRKSGTTDVTAVLGDREDLLSNGEGDSEPHRDADTWPGQAELSKAAAYGIEADAAAVPPTRFTDEESSDDARKPRNPIARLLNAVVPKGGVLSGMFNLASVTLGAGIMSIPAAFNTAGVIMSVIYLVVVTTLTVYSISLLVTAAEKTGLHSFEALARGLLGRGGDYVVAALMWLLCFGGAVGYVIAVGDVFTSFLHHDNVPAFLQKAEGRRCLVSAVWLFFMFPLVLPKQINSLRYVSAVGVIFIVFFVVCVIVHSAQNGLKGGVRKDLVMVRTGNSGISGVSIFIFAYLCQVNCLRINSESRHPSVRYMTLQAALSCTICGVLYFLVGFFGYADFGPSLTGNILKRYDPYANPMFFVCFLGIIVKLCAAFSLNMLACRTALFNVLQWDVPSMPYWKHTIVSVAFAVAALLLGLFVPDINIVFGLVGSFCGGFIAFVFPSLFIMYAGHWSLRTVGWLNYLATYFLLLCGVIAIVFGTISTIYSVITG